MPTTAAPMTVPYGTVTDTTADLRWQVVRVVAYMVEPVVRLAEHPMCLDGPLSWCAYQAARETGATIPPILPDWTADFALPLATWVTSASRTDPDPRLLAADGQRVWGWACSAASYTTSLHTSVQIRRHPETLPMARYTPDRKHESARGALKARDVTLPAVWTDTITWHALAEPERLSELLTHLTHLGMVTGHGHGRIGWIEVVEHGDRDAWRSRPMPDPAGIPGSIRAPYHHHSRRMPCSSTHPA